MSKQQRASDRLGTREAFNDPEFLASCAAAIALWKEDPAIQLEFVSIVDFFDWLHAVAEDLIESATK
jgi:hypothetical protein